MWPPTPVIVVCPIRGGVKGTVTMAPWQNAHPLVPRARVGVAPVAVPRRDDPVARVVKRAGPEPRVGRGPEVGASRRTGPEPVVGAAPAAVSGPTAAGRVSGVPGPVAVTPDLGRVRGGTPPEGQPRVRPTRGIGVGPRAGRRARRGQEQETPVPARRRGSTAHLAPRWFGRAGGAWPGVGPVPSGTAPRGTDRMPIRLKGAGGPEPAPTSSFPKASFAPMSVDGARRPGPGPMPFGPPPTGRSRPQPSCHPTSPTSSPRPPGPIGTSCGNGSPSGWPPASVPMNGNGIGTPPAS